MLREQKQKHYSLVKVARQINRPKTSNAIVQDEKKYTNEKMPAIKRDLM